MPENIRKARNIAIILGIIEFFCCIASVAFYVRRRSRIILAIIVGAFLASIIGMFAKLTLQFESLLGHATFTIAVIGGFYIYLVIDFSLSNDKNQSNGGLSEFMILVLLSLPLLFIFIMGIYSLLLVLMLDEEIEERNKQRHKVNPFGKDDHDRELAEKENVIEVLKIDLNSDQD
jgi:hypothetical protein